MAARAASCKSIADLALGQTPAEKRPAEVTSDDVAMTPQACYAKCMEQQSVYFGLHGGDKCACFDTFELQTTDVVCDTPCPGNASAVCGGQAPTAYSVAIMFAWVEKLPERSCGPPTRVVNAASMCTGGGPTQGRDCNVTCADGYRLAVNSLLCDTARGDWMGVASCLEVTCHGAPQVLNSQKVCTSASAAVDGGACAVTCMPGYELAENALRCVAPQDPRAAHGTYSGKAICKPVSCGVPPARELTTSIKTEVEFPQMVTYTCTQGSTLSGERGGNITYTTTCQADGTFLPTVEKCQAVPCGAAPLMSNARLVPPEDARIPSEWTFPQSPKFACEPGFTLDATGAGLAAFEIPCQASGNFSPAPSCQRVICGDAPVLSFASSSPAGPVEIAYGSTVQYTCGAGYALSPTDIVQKAFDVSCEATGLFAGIQSCVPVSCGFVPPVENARTAAAEVFFPFTHAYSCLTGYTLNGTAAGDGGFEATCQADATFAKMPACLPVTCGTPASFEHASFRSDTPPGEKHYPESLTYDCDEGYSIDRSPEGGAKTWVMQCLPTGHFTAPHQCLNIDDCVGHSCGPYGHCVDLLMNYTCKCASGFQVTADEEGELICGNIDDCGPQACGEGGTCKDLVNDYTCECEKGYELKTLEDGEKTCSRVECGLPPEVEHAVAPLGKAAFGDVVEYACDAGYSTNGQADGPSAFSSECLATRTFTRTPGCMPLVCGTPPAAPMATVLDAPVVFPEVAKYQCAQGHSTDGSATGNKSFSIACTATGQFSALAACQPVSCGPAPTLEMATVVPQGSSLSYGQAANYTCTPGHSLEATDPSSVHFSRSCMADGQFENARKCVPVTCKLPLVAKAGTLTIMPPASGALFRSPVSVEDACASFCGKAKLETCTSVVGEESCSGSYMWSPLPGDKVGTVVPCEWTGSTCRASNEYGDHVFGCYSPTDYCSGTGPSPPEFCKSGLKSEDGACCPASCTTCGGYGCQGFPGGESQCCAEPILESGTRCTGPEDTACAIPKPAKLSLEHSVVPFRKRVTYQCPLGRTIDGLPSGAAAFTATCSAEGRLEGLLNCQKVAALGPPPIVAHAKLSVKQSTFFSGDRILFTTDSGFAVSPALGKTGKLVLDGAPITAFKVKVLPTGFYEITPPILNIDDCAGHFCGPHGTCQDGIDNYTCLCEEGFEINILDSGEKICGNVDDCGPDACGEHGVCIDLVSDYTCDCKSGYELVNMTKEGKAEKVCSAKKCPTLPAVAFSDLKQNASLRYPEDVKVICKEGYSIDGTATYSASFFSVQCQADGTLSSTFECRPVECGVRPIVALAMPANPDVGKDKVYVFGEEAGYVCPEGHSLDGQPDGLTHTSLPCGSDAQFPSPPSCTAVTCGEPPRMPNAAPSALVASFPASVSYTCDAGYALDPKQPKANTFAFKCASSGSFELETGTPDGDIPSCQRVACSEPPAFSLASYEPGVKYFGDVVSYTCQDGTSSDGTMRGRREWSITCGSTGAYSPSAASACQAVTFKMVGRILDATNLRAVKGATVTINKDGVAAASAATNRRGQFRVEGVPMGQVQLKAEKSGYIVGTKNLLVERSVLSGEAADLTISPVLPPDGWRIVLRWDERPRDLDSHVYFGRRQSCHGYYGNTRLRCGNGIGSVLDVDDMNGVGPETITLTKVSGSCHRQRRGQCKIVFKVHNYSGRPGLERSGAVVKVYNGDREMGEFRVGNGDGIVRGNWWSAFSIDGKAGTVGACTSANCQ